MPAIDLARLRLKSAHLANHIHHTDIFMRSLRDLLEFYADRTLRLGQTTSPIKVLPSYRVPLPVLRQIEADLAPFVEDNAEAIAQLADLLWEERGLETRLLAAYLLGQIPPLPNFFDHRFGIWVSETREPALLKSLLTHSLQRLRKEQPARFFILIGGFLSPNQQKNWAKGIQALVPLLADPNFDNMPDIFALVQPIIEASPSLLQIELASLLNALYQTAPMETIHFMRQTLAESTNPQTVVGMRRIAPRLSEPLARALRS